MADDGAPGLTLGQRSYLAKVRAVAADPTAEVKLTRLFRHSSGEVRIEWIWRAGRAKATVHQSLISPLGDAQIAPDMIAPGGEWALLESYE